ncbi:MAG: hypothetical protein Q9N68_09960 [Gammaproteobacteria bacterium]|nr:hypothetical protein [Gammaproteobacteria bacterium]
MFKTKVGFVALLLWFSGAVLAVEYAGAETVDAEVVKGCEAEGSAEGWQGKTLKAFVEGCIDDFANS